MRVFLLFAALGFILISGLASAHLHSVSVSVDPNLRYQTINRQEGTSDLSITPPVETRAETDAMLDAAVDRVGINRVRLEARSGAETRSDAAERYLAGQLPHSAQVWTPPAPDAIVMPGEPNVACSQTCPPLKHSARCQIRGGGLKSTG